MPDYRINKDFNRLFLQKEQKELFGKGYRNFYYLGLILFITFLVLGFANGSLEYLKKKMDDPFIKWINVEISHTLRDEIQKTFRELDKQAIKDSFNIEDLSGYFQYTMFFLNKDGNQQFQALGRTIHHNNRIFQRISEKKNLLIGEAEYGENDIGIIITKDLLVELGFEDYPSHINMSYPVDKGVYKPAPIPVIGVVDQLPGRSHFVTTPYFYMKRNYSPYRPFNILAKEYTKTLELFFPYDKHKTTNVRDQIMSFVQKNSEWKALLIDVPIQEYDKSYQPGYIVRLIFDEDWATHDKLDNVFSDIQMEFSELYHFTKIYSYNLSGNDPLRDKYDYLSFYFSSLDKIRDFQKFMDVTYNLKIDMTQIESKENYNFVSKLTLIISIFLICFSILSIVFFIINLLKSHIQKIKKNLGTFKAFGLSNKALIKIYVFMALRFLLITCILAFVLSFLLGELGLVRILLSLFKIKLEENQNYFDLMNWVSYLAIPIILLINGIIVRFSLSGVLSRTPGNLIYQRD